MSVRLGTVVISGAGVVAPLGHTPAEVFDALLAGRSAVAPITRFPTDAFPCKIGAAVTGFKAAQWVSNRKNLKLMSEAVQYGVAAVKRAWIDAGLEGAGINPERIGLFCGAGTAVGRT
ncbi:MAG: hypothetical protein KC583_17870, partial [Myxococcales bacterium]|nr:hypothetical protein [Myxococcales bacterium]